MSGPGLVNVYEFVLGSAIADHVDPAFVANHALARSDQLCEQALDIMLDAYGAECRALALQFVFFSSISPIEIVSDTFLMVASLSLAGLRQSCFRE